MTLDAPHTQAETARPLVEDKHAHYLMTTLLQAAAKALAAPTPASRMPPGPKKATGTAAASGGPSAPPRPTA